MRIACGICEQVFDVIGSARRTARLFHFGIHFAIDVQHLIEELADVFSFGREALAQLMDKFIRIVRDFEMGLANEIFLLVEFPLDGVFDVQHSQQRADAAAFAKSAEIMDARVEDILPAFFCVGVAIGRFYVSFPRRAKSAWQIMLLEDRHLESAFGEQGGGGESADA